MGGVMIRVAVDSQKALEWFDREGLSYLAAEEGPWMVTTLSSKTRDIGAVWSEDYIFYGVADDRERPAGTRKMNKAFGNKLAKLRKAVMDEFRELRKYKVVDIAGEDVARIAAAVALGSLLKDGGEWVVKARDCEAVTVDVSAIE
jgi:hypothetical protein